MDEYEKDRRAKFRLKLGCGAIVVTYCVIQIVFFFKSISQDEVENVGRVIIAGLLGGISYLIYLGINFIRVLRNKKKNPESEDRIFNPGCSSILVGIASFYLMVWAVLERLSGKVFEVAGYTFFVIVLLVLAIVFAYNILKTFK